MRKYLKQTERVTLMSVTLSVCFKINLFQNIYPSLNPAIPVGYMFFEFSILNEL